MRAFDAQADGTIFSEAATMVVLKRLETARADGDRILGVITGCGLSSDGRDKAIAAPSPAGQRRAIERAWTAAGVCGTDVDWVIAHGTGTLAGDRVEIDVLSGLSGVAGLTCTANKSLLGHPGWAAGGVSVIHALLALEHGSIPAQQRFTTPHPALEGSGLRVPTTPVPWPSRAGRARRVGVSSFGLGGANAHLVVQDQVPDSPRTPEPSPALVADPVVLMAWSASLPGNPDQKSVRDWLVTDCGMPGGSFGDTYPSAPFAVTKLPPVITKVIDRSHLMALDVAYRFVEEHGELWNGYRETTGVIAAQAGLTRSWHDVTLRAASGDLESSPLQAADRDALSGLLSEVRARQAITEESFAGSTASVAAHRITKRWDLHGPAMTLDTGATSAHVALHTARQYLAAGTVDVALVLCLNENSTPQAAKFAGTDAGTLAEGAFLLALTRESLARKQSWPMLARLDSHTNPAHEHKLSATGPVSRDYLGAQGAVELLRVLHRGGHGQVVSASPPLTLSLAPVTSQSREQATTRWALTLRRENPTLASAPRPAVPALSVVLAGSAGLAASVADEARSQGAVLLSTDPSTDERLATVIDEITDESTLDGRLDSLLGGQQAHVLVLAEAPVSWPATDPAHDRLLELSLLVLKRCHARIKAGDGTLTMILHDPLTDIQIHPGTALFTGFARSLAREVPPEQVLALVTDAPPAAARTELAAELAARRDRTVVYYRGGLRHTERLCPLALPAADRTSPNLGDQPVVVAVGGARGITAVAVQALADRCHPTLWLLGRTDPRMAPAPILEAGEEQQAQLRAQFITGQRRTQPHTSAAALNRLFERHWAARETVATVRRLREICGDARVHYVACDVTDAEAVTRSAQAVLEAEGHVDLLIHAACHQEAAVLPHKTLAAFRAGIAAKATGYRHLKAAFADCPPRLWVNFGSALGALGFPGESDYCAANDFLAAAARYENRLYGAHEITIGWGLWEESGKVSGAPARERLSLHGITAGITDTEAIALFLAELAHPRTAEPAPLYATTQDHDTADTYWPGYFHTPAPDFTPPGILGAPAEAGPGWSQWQWSVDSDRDRYLTEHLVTARPALPAMAMVALAVEATAQLLPGIRVQGLRNIRFDDLVRADPAIPGPTKYRIHARITSQPGKDGAHGRVQVRILSDITARDGRILRTDRRHTTLIVLTGPSGSAPGLTAQNTLATFHSDPHLNGHGPIQLTGPFRNTVDLESGPTRAQGRWLPVLDSGDFFSSTHVPVLLLDALLRLGSYPRPTPTTAQLKVPTAIRVGRHVIPRSESILSK
ncbi:SDR family NAD(P)-dependent oxidoreductase [Streptomyces olivoreticuli]|uniref:SDR family NAD(P)-dependent oxidoreductase n=1 Tax=Streptomyces olivoreticuli TaxID=68246 RepID=UPI003462ACCD